MIPQPEPQDLFKDLIDMSVLYSYLGVILIIVLIMINLSIYKKARIWLLMVFMFIFSIIMSAVSILLKTIFSPFIQVFYIMISFILLLATSIEAYSK